MLSFYVCSVTVEEKVLAVYFLDYTGGHYKWLWGSYYVQMKWIHGISFAYTSSNVVLLQVLVKHNKLIEKLINLKGVIGK